MPDPGDTLLVLRCSIDEARAIVEGRPDGFAIYGPRALADLRRAGRDGLRAALFGGDPGEPSRRGPTGPPRGAIDPERMDADDCRRFGAALFRGLDSRPYHLSAPDVVRALADGGFAVSRDDG